MSPPAVITGVPAAELVTVPPPANDPMVSLKLAKSNVPVTVIADPSAITPLAPNFNFPALIVVAPAYVFAPDNVQVPASCFVTVPATVPMILVILPPCAPPKVNPNPEPVMVPTLLSAIVPVPPIILLADPRVTNPLYVAAAPLFINDPPLDTPVPFKVSASAVPNVKPPKSNAAPVADTTVPAPVVPSGVFAAPPVAPNFKIPALIVVKPV